MKAILRGLRELLCWFVGMFALMWAMFGWIVPAITNKPWDFVIYFLGCLPALLFIAHVIGSSDENPPTQ